MKKLIVMAAAGVLALTLAGCGSDEPPTTEPAQTGDQVEQVESDDGEAAQAVTDAGEAEGEFSIEIGSCTLTEDYEGNPAIVVEYTWTNLSDDAQMFDVAVIAKAFQNGIELDLGTISYDNEQFDMDASWKEIKSGTTQTAYRAFLLDDMSEVTVEVEGWFSDGPVAEKAFTLE